MQQAYMYATMFDTFNSLLYASERRKEEEICSDMVQFAMTKVKMKALGALMPQKWMLQATAVLFSIMIPWNLNGHSSNP